MTAAGLIFSAFFPAALGAAVLTVILSENARSSRLERIGFGYPLGAALITLWMAVMPVFGLLFSFLTITAPLGLVSAVLIIRNRQKFLRPAWRAGERRKTSAPFWVVPALLAWIALKYLWVFFEVAVRPVNAWDAVAYWSLMAKYFFYEHTWSPALAALTRGASQPLFNPLIQVWTAECLGTWTDNWIQLPFALMFLSLGIASYAVFRRYGSRFSALIPVLLLAGLPFADLHATMAYSDLPLAVFHGLAYLLLLASWAEDDRTLLGMSGVMMVLSIWVKRHGLVYLAVWAAVAALVSWISLSDEQKKKRLRHLPAAIGLGSVLTFLFLGIFWMRIGALADWGWHGGRFVEVLGRLGARLFTYGHWNILGVMWLGAMVVTPFLAKKPVALKGKPVSRPELKLFWGRRFLLYTPLALLGLYVAFYMICGDELYRWFLDGTVVNRYVLHVIPVMGIGVALALAEVLQQNAPAIK